MKSMILALSSILLPLVSLGAPLPPLAAKMAGKYQSTAACQLRRGFDSRAYKYFTLQTGDPVHGIDQELFGVHAKADPQGTDWVRLLAVKLDELDKVVRIANGGDAYNRLVKEKWNAYLIYVQHCPMGFCREWQEVGRVSLLPSGNIFLRLSEDNAEAEGGPGECTLKRIP